MARSHLNISIFPDERHILVRPKGELSGSEIGEGSLARIMEMPDAFTYDHLLDLRRFDGAVMSSELAEFGQTWREAAAGRDAGARTAIVSTDALLRARLSFYRQQFPEREIEVFDTFDEALDWLKTRRA
ncbi:MULTISPECIES: hypothetical protein [Asticcacaulis]|uniref:hypothetical protein n=1 Tax=Asticcacaulis TaxID=76890 RepID=UPI001AE5EBF1|nr:MULTISPECIES: hypothetical protein [Asticcacaulis]MBP2158897.1 hypothetical protein [Asticcacaulis solisilvae]MDR6799942.1 hypothetical protein [Asticcacaulis sp. BE141]